MQADKETQRCIDTTTTISIHKQLRAAAHFSLAAEVKEFAQISLIKEAN